MTYHYNQNTGLIQDIQTSSTNPVTNPIYNIFIQEAIQLNLNAYITSAQELYIVTPNQNAIILTNLYIVLLNRKSYEHKLIPYEYYTTLEELIQDPIINKYSV